MKVKGKFFIKANEAREASRYWNQQEKQWTFDPKSATFFDSVDAAVAEAYNADDLSDCESIVLQATKNLPY